MSQGGLHPQSLLKQKTELCFPGIRCGPYERDGRSCLRTCSRDMVVKSQQKEVGVISWYLEIDQRESYDPENNISSH